MARKYHIWAILLLMVCVSSCFSDYSKSELAGRSFYADDGAVIRLNSDGSCQVENLNWSHVWCEDGACDKHCAHLADSLNFQKVQVGTWDIDEYDKYRICISMNTFVFYPVLSSGYNVLPTPADEVKLIIFIGDPDDWNTYEFKQRKRK